MSAPRRLGADARSHLKSTIDDEIEELASILLENARASKKVWVTCMKCGKKTEADVTDVKASTDAIDKLIAMGYGRATASSAKAEGFILERRIVRPDDEDASGSGGEYEGGEDGAGFAEAPGGPSVA